MLGGTKKEDLKGRMGFASKKQHGAVLVCACYGQVTLLGRYWSFSKFGDQNFRTVFTEYLLVHSAILTVFHFH
jgi:hypothetical protein